MSRVNSALVPPFGFRFPRNFPEEDNTWIEADTFQNLVSKITDFRVINKFPLGNPEQDAEGFICGKYPNHCTPTGSGGTLPEKPDEPKNLRERVTSWASNRYARVGAIEFVAQPEADRRALICSTCPQNQEWRNGCPPCVASTERTLILIRQAQSTIPLGACQICGHDNQTAAFLMDKDLKHKDKFMVELPDFCWLK